MAKQKYKFIVFEGVDGSGKTTLAKLLAKEIKAAYYHAPSEVLRPLRNFIEDSHPEVKLAYYLLGDRIADQEIAVLLKKGHVVSDRYIYSTLAYQQAQLKRKLVADAKHIRPDYVVHLTADIKTIQQRLEGKSKLLKSENVTFLKKVQKEYPNHLPENTLGIDTSKLSIDEAMDIIRKNVRLD